MHRLLSIALSCLFAVSLSAQEPSITYPYNPDSNTDSLIGASDLVDFLPFYGEEFTPEPLTIEGMSLEEWMEQQTSSSGGGCDFNYPDGFDGEPLTLNNINLYEVPDGKNLYITSIYNGSNNYVQINDITVQYGYMNTPDETELSTSINFPLILSESDVLTASSSSISINGYLIDSSVQAITLNYLNSSYNVPSGKNLYITSIYNPSSSGLVYINDVTIRYGTSNSGGPWLLKAGDFLSTSNSSTSVNGYLVDEDYFADCGGGGGVDISGLQEQIDAVADDSYAADEILQAQIFNLQEQLDSALSNIESMNEQSVENSIPTGTIISFAGEALPEGWLLCDGSAISIMEYHELYDVLGNIYGTGDDSYTLEWVDENNDGMMQPEEMIEVPSTFSLPDLRGRVQVGLDNMGGIAAQIVDEASILGFTSGEKIHQLTVDEMPSHVHDLYPVTLGGAVGGGNPGGTNTSGAWPSGPGIGTILSQPAGGDQAHNNMQPYITINYLIKY